MAAVEIVFVNVNPQSTLLLGQARGACVTALVSCDLPVAEYTALQMKQAVAGHGQAAKAQVQEMVKRLLQLPGLPGKDAADALGLAITHAHAGRSMARLAQAAGTGAQHQRMYKRRVATQLSRTRGHGSHGIAAQADSRSQRSSTRKKPNAAISVHLRIDQAEALVPRLPGAGIEGEGHAGRQQQQQDGPAEQQHAAACLPGARGLRRSRRAPAVSSSKVTIS